MNEILDFISDGGLITIGALAAWLGYKYVNQKLFKRHKIRNPEKHFFFINAKRLKFEKLESMNIFTPNNKICSVRSEMFRNMMTIKIDTWSEHMQEFIQIARREKYTSNRLSNMLTSLIESMMSDYERQWRYDGVPEIVIKKFRDWHSGRATTLVKGMISICEGNCFSSLDEKLNAILELNSALLYMTFIDAEKTLVDLNGELSGSIYKNNIIE